jgi:3-oxoacyl-[acyl-carrier-protein] synthase-3
VPNDASEQRSPGFYASHVSYVLGEPVPISETTDPEVREQIEVLHEQGIEHHLVDRRSVAELAVAAARPVLDALDGLRPELLIYCTDTSTGEAVTRQMWQMQNEIGLIDTPAVLVSGGGCGNLGAGLKVARAVMATERLSTVLFVTADRVPGPIGRFLQHGSTVLSDSAAACVLTAGPIAAGIRILGMFTEVRSDVSTSVNQLAMGRTIMHKIGRALNRVSAESGVRPAECRYFLTGNFGRTSRYFLTTAARCTPEQAYGPWAADLGHCFSADILISLSTLMERGELDPADRLLMLSSSPQSWSVIAAEYTAA